MTLIPETQVGELEGHAPRLPGAVNQEDVAPLRFLELPAQGRQTLQVDGDRVEGVAVGEPLEGSEGNPHPPFRELFPDLGELAVGEEPSLAHAGNQVEGIAALGRGDRVGGEDPAGVLGAGEKDLSDGQGLTGILDRPGDGLLDVK